MEEKRIKLIECPRDAMQGWKTWIPTGQKVAYINSLLKVGFDTLDFGSFVSPKAIPQMADTREVVTKLEMGPGDTKLLAIVANLQGAAEAAVYDQITYLGFPFSVSETFQRRNTNAGIVESLQRVAAIQEICLQRKKQLVVYLSMGFGNPYGDPYNEEIVYGWVKELVQLGINIISLADTVGLASPDQIYSMMKHIIEMVPAVETGVHLHSTPANWEEKMAAAFSAGCLRFDGALKGIGGCPMADDELVGNMNTEWMIEFLQSRQMPAMVNQEALEQSLALAGRIFV